MKPTKLSEIRKVHFGQSGPCGFENEVIIDQNTIACFKEKESSELFGWVLTLRSDLKKENAQNVLPLLYQLIDGLIDQKESPQK